MRLIPAFLVLACLAVTPAMAQTAAALPAPADIGPNVDRDFWCATAFGLTAYIAGQSGDQATATADTGKMETLFSGIVTLMKAGNFEEAQFTAMNGLYTTKVMNPFASDAEGYTREVCETAFSEAEVFVAAAMAEQAEKDAAAAAEKPAEPATPNAPAADAPAADAPAKPAP
jgi:hypothetical protein